MSNINGHPKEYRQGPYIYQNKKNPMEEYQQSASFRKGVNQDMLG
jgi:serine/threonine-protein phosphatase PP1 catalytic subunit